MKNGNEGQPTAWRGRALALLVLTGFMVMAGGCQKSKPASDPRQVADRFMDLYYAQMNMAEAIKLCGGDARKKLRAQLDAVKGVQPDKPAGEPRVTFEVTASDKPSSTEASYTYRVTAHTSDVAPIVVQLSLSAQKERWRVSSISESKSPKA